ncbi:hypothetical protein [Thermococcus sp. Bubb.Bath]|uniref:hypothetical protein n=1 Tax=Thermococcus sp. Bubb.Bath TaxID=1638242 RepID=UPI001F1149CC|nr:hypothetical protein [Thermococcus sp. Bubb.Bath]
MSNIFHPWEFIEMSRKLRPDCWFGTGDNALENLRRLIEFHWILVQRSSPPTR